jgi:hypothetical protein
MPKEAITHAFYRHWERQVHHAKYELGARADILSYLTDVSERLARMIIVDILY